MRNQQAKSKSIQITMSGFTQDPNYEHYKSIINKLGGVFHENLRENTSILIIRNVTSQKFKIANIRKQSIKIVILQWLLDSQKYNKFIDTKQYYIPGLFYGATIGIYGFEFDQQVKIKQFLIQNKATVNIINKSILSQKLINQDLIIVSPKQLLRVQQTSEKIEKPVVTIDWMQRCSQRKYCVYPQDYSINKQGQKFNASMEILMKNIPPKLEDIIKNVELNDPKYNFLKDTFIYIHDYGDKPIQIIRQLISVCGGFYLTQFNSITTHVISNNYTQGQYNTWMKYGNLIQIVKIKWLIDNLFTMKRLPEQDYRTRKMSNKFEARIIDKNELSNEFNPSSFTFGNNQFNSNSFLPDLRKSISFTAIDKQKEKQKQKKESANKIKTTLFTGYNFFIFPQQKKKEQLKGMNGKIIQNGGCLYQNISLKLKSIHFILVDSNNNEEILNSFNKYKNIIKPISYRWINLCINKNHLIKQDQPNYFIFKPFFFPTPMEELVKIKIQILGYDEVIKRRIRQLINVIGDNKIYGTKASITHAICQQSKYKQQKKYEQLKLANPNIKFLKLDWIFDSIKQKKVIDLQPYLVQ